MFEGLLKSKFYTKSKSAIKMTKSRIEIIKRKRNAMQKFLRNDIADLLKSGLDVNAYGRVEGLWIEMNYSGCYDFVEQFCNHVSSHLTEMNKQSKYEFISWSTDIMAALNCLSQKNRISNINSPKKECPDDCREAVCSLMFAAARFADLPELRDLRSIFIERYGSSIDCYANKEFVHKLKLTHPSKDMKLQLMQDIATESGLEWNAKSLEQNLFKHPIYGQEYNKNDNAGESNDPEIIDSVQSTDNKVAEFKDEDQGKYASLAGEGGYLSYGRKESLTESDTSNYREGSEHKRADGLAVREDVHRQDDPVDEVKSKPKSVRRNKKPQSGHEKVYSSEPENAEKRSKMRKASRDRNSDSPETEEEIMDRLLLHYSGKKPSDTGKSEPIREPAFDRCSDKKNRDRNGLQTRTPSLPVELSHVDASKGHVHPKLPDYDDFVARLAAVRGNLN